jgi:hypothetical protein
MVADHFAPDATMNQIGLSIGCFRSLSPDLGSALLRKVYMVALQ